MSHHSVFCFATIRHTMIEIPYYETSYFALHNFSAHAIVINGVIYPTAEHAFHAFKFTDNELSQKIIECASPIAAYKLAKELKPQRRSDWDEIKVDILTNIVRHKVQQNPDVKEVLLLSGDELIVEVNPNDDFWGSGPNGDGLNQTGRILMKVRDELRATSS